jgi:uncharacterized protein (TIGR00255 family)
MVKQSVKRGKIDIMIKWERAQGQSSSVRINETVIGQYVDMAQTLKEVYGIKGDLTLETVFGLRDIIAYEENTTIPEEIFLRAVDSLLEKLNEEKAREGALMYDDLLVRLGEITHYLKEIEERWPSNIKTYEEKLREKVMEAAKMLSIEEGRILQELAIYTERLDISEEIVRLGGHLANFRDTIDSEGAIGRKLDFIVQEMVREANTIGSKSNDLYINERVVQIKVEIEKMREQAQNVE